MLHLFRIFVLLLGLMIAACASVDGKPSQQNSATPSQKQSTLKDGQLPPRDLSAGQCGLFVWTGDAQRRFILFSDSQNNRGSLAAESSETALQITSESGFGTYFQYPITSYTAATGETVNLALGDYEDITSGRRYKSGTLKITREDGWEQVIPVIGLAVCQPVA